MISIADKDGNIIENGTNSGASNGYAATFRFSQPGSAYKDVVVMQDGQIIREIPDGSMRVGSQAEHFLWKPMSDSDGRLVILTGSAPDTEEGDENEGQSDGGFPQDGEMPGQEQIPFYDENGNYITPEQVLEQQGFPPSAFPPPPTAPNKLNQLQYGQDVRGQMSDAAMENLKRKQLLQQGQ